MKFAGWRKTLQDGKQSWQIVVWPSIKLEQQGIKRPRTKWLQEMALRHSGGILACPEESPLSCPCPRPRGKGRPRERDEQCMGTIVRKGQSRMLTLLAVALKLGLSFNPRIRVFSMRAR